MRGFSAVGIIIKHVGASFLFINSLFLGGDQSIFLSHNNRSSRSCTLWLVQYCAALYFYDTVKFIRNFSNERFTIYSDDSESNNNNTEDTSKNKPAYKEKYLLWLLFPLVPIILAKLIPSTMSLFLNYPFSHVVITNSVKPITQILSHLPQLKVCYQLKTTSGVALLSQHLNLIGGIAGLYSKSIFFTK